MKIKCPACSKVLSIPETAAGKVIKCPCGKQLRAPGGAGGGGAAPTTPSSPAGAASRPGAAKPTAKKPAAAPASPSAGMGGFDASMLDELTDGDLAPVKSMSKAGQPVAQPNAAKGNAVLQKYASEGDRRGEALIHQGLAPRPPFLMVIGGWNLVGALFYFLPAMLLLGLVAMIPAFEEELPDEEGGGMLLGVLVAALIVMGILCIATAAACFVRSIISWYILAFSYSYGFADRILGIVGDVMNDDLGIVRAAGGVLIGLGLWAYIHGEDVRAFHGADDIPISKIIAVNAAGFLVGCLLSGAVVMMVAGE